MLFVRNSDRPEKEMGNCGRPHMFHTGDCKGAVETSWLFP